MNKFAALIILGTLLTCPSAVRISYANEGKLAPMDSEFVTKAAQGGMAEVKLGEIAQKNGGSEEVKSFGKQLVKDHSDANQQLIKIAVAKSVKLPTEPSEEQKLMAKKMESMHGAEFDRMFTEHMMTAHRDTIELFEKESTEGKDKELMAFARNTLPTLREHLEDAKELK